MSGRLWIGVPRELNYRNFANPYIWLVPGIDPNGKPGQARVGKPCFVWAKITNRAELLVEDARVDFFYCLFSTSPAKRTAMKIGYAFVTLRLGESEDVLCLSPFTPTHPGASGCLIAVVNHFADPLPAGDDWFWHGAISQVGQRNIYVLEANDPSLHIIAFEVPAPATDSKRVRLRITRPTSPAQDLDQLLWSTALGHVASDRRIFADTGLSPTEVPASDWRSTKEMLLDFKDVTSRTAYVVAQRQYGQAGFDLIDISTESDGRTLGGISLLIAG